MTLAEIKSLLEGTGFPVAYHHFIDVTEPPFVVYLVPDTNNIGADDGVYINVNTVRIELYTDKKDISAEKAVEDLLQAADVFYDKSETWVADQRLYEIIYESEVI